MNESLRANPSRWSERLHGHLIALLLTGIAACALSAAFLDSGHFYFAWVAFVPLLFVLRDASVLRAYWLATLFGFVAFALGKSWLFDFIQLSKGFTSLKAASLAALYYAYSAQQFGIAAMLTVWISQRSRLRLIGVFPIVFGAVSMMFPMLFPFRLGETQTTFTLALQGVDVTGTHGLDFVILCVNALLFFMVLKLINRSVVKIDLSVVCVALVPLIWMAYGLMSTTHWSNQLKESEPFKVGWVQPNEIPKLGKRSLPLGFTAAYPPEMQLSEQLAEAELVELIIWPESQPKSYFDNARIGQSFAASVAGMSTPLLFQDFRKKARGEGEHFNSAVLLNENGVQAGVYDKIKRIPFGEYVPVSRQNNKLHQGVKQFLGEYLFEIAPGEAHKSLPHPKAELLPFICYETTFPSYVARAVNQFNQSAMAKPAVLVGLSNDGWFASRQQAHQHIVASTLRAVENRLPLVHVSNNGPSIIVSPTGKLLARTPFAVAGGYSASVPLLAKAKPTVFNTFPNGFKFTLYLTLLIFLCKAFFAQRSRE